MEEALTSARVVKAFAREDYEMRRFESESLENVETALRARGLKATLAPLVEVIVAIGTCLVLWYGARLALDGRISAGVLIVFLLYLGNMYKPMRDLSKQTDTVSKAIVGYERIQEVLEIESQVRDLPRARRAPRFKGKIEFDHVHFSYDGGTPVLKDVSFRIEAGQVAALVGPSGMGKTTIGSLIPRFYDPTSGTVKIDGNDIRNFKLQSLREQISFVLQETLLFRATVWDNIAYGKPDAKPQGNHASRAACECRRIHRDVAAGIFHDDRRARRFAFGRPKATHRHRAGHYSQHSNPDFRRADLRPRRRSGANRDGGPGPADGGQNRRAGCAPSEHDPPRGCDFRGQGCRNRRARIARGTPCSQRTLCGAVQTPNRECGEMSNASDADRFVERKEGGE